MILTANEEAVDETATEANDAAQIAATGTGTARGAAATGIDRVIGMETTAVGIGSRAEIVNGIEIEKTNGLPVAQEETVEV